MLSASFRTMKYILLALIVLLTSCTSDYAPSELMLEHKKNMSRANAVTVLQAIFWSENAETSMCATRGFWYDKQAGLVVQEHNVALFAYTKGRILRSEGGGFGGKTVYEKKYYKYEFPFKDVEEIIIHKSFSRLKKFVSCTKHEKKENYVVVDIFASNKSSIKLVVYENQFDEVMAALTILLSTRPVIVINI